jgi:phi13 family phage major tail protein
MNKGVVVGLRNLYYALLEDDPISGSPSYDIPVRVPGIIKATMNPNGSVDTLFAEDGPYETAANTGKISLELNVADLPLDVQAAWLGHTKQGGILIRKGTDIPPWLAIGYVTTKSNGHNRYTWLAKGKFAEQEQANETKGENINFQTPTITGSFVKRNCDGEWIRQADEDDDDYVASIGANWFLSVTGGVVDNTAPSLSSSVPANAATDVAVDSAIVLTFDKALLLSTVTLGNIFVVKDTDGSIIDGALTINEAKKIVTFTPSTTLAAATKYRLIISDNVKSAWGIALASPIVYAFTTA